MSETVTVCSNPGCVPCTITRRKLGSENIDYLLVEFTQDDKALEHIKSLGHLQACHRGDLGPLGKLPT